MNKSDVQTILDHITSERRKVENYIDDELEKTNAKVDALQKGVSGLKQDMSNLENKVDNLENKVDNLENRFDNLENKVDNLENRFDNLENKVDNLTDAVIEGFDNTERVLSDWEGKRVNLISKQKRDKLQETG